MSSENISSIVYRFLFHVFKSRGKLNWHLLEMVAIIPHKNIQIRIFIGFHSLFFGHSEILSHIHKLLQ